MIYNFCGDTKGKTSTALGTIIRALGHRQKVRTVFFMKNWQTSETTFLNRIADLPGNPFDIDHYLAGEQDFIFVDESTNHETLENVKRQLKFGKVHEKTEADVKSAQMGYMKSISYLEEDPFLLVLDELNLAVAFGLVSISQALNLIETANAKGIHLVLTGRNLPDEIAKKCDLVTEMKKIKHPFDEGVYAVKGLDY